MPGRKTTKREIAAASFLTRFGETGSAAEGESARLLEEMRAIRQELGTLTRALQQPQKGSLTLEPQSPEVLPLRVKIFFQCKQSVRKPYRLEVEGAVQLSEGLSVVRAAIFIVLFLDLRSRLEGGDGAADPLAEITKIVRLLDPDSNSRDEANMIRVAVYRFFDYFERDQPLQGSELQFRFQVDKVRLLLEGEGGTKLERPVQLELATNDPQLEHIFSTAFHSSPLSIVRRRKSLFVPAGPSGADRLLLEMYNHPYKLRVTSLYVRPPFQSYPERLLKHIGISERVIERKRIAFEGYKEGRFHFLEILPKQVIWNLIRKDKDKRFMLYPEAVGKAHVLDHLDNLIYILKNYEHYEFYVTDATIPFALVTYAIESGVVPEYYSVFFQSFGAAQDQDLGCFILSDPHVYQSISDHIVNWVVTHQSTLRVREDVVSFLKRVRTHLEKKGPLQANEPAPHSG